jgi:hypothetical protein
VEVVHDNSGMTQLDACLSNNVFSVSRPKACRALHRGDGAAIVSGTARRPSHLKSAEKRIRSPGLKSPAAQSLEQGTLRHLDEAVSLPITLAQRQTLEHALTPNNLDHFFAAKHNFSPLVAKFGSREAVDEQAVRSLGSGLPSSGVFEVVRVIGGQPLTVRGAVVNGVPKLGTMFIA